MNLLRQYEQSGVYDPRNPAQRTRTVWTNDGYNTFYFNRVPNESSLHGMRGLNDFSTTFAGWPSWMQVGLVGLLSAGVGYFAMAKFGDKYIKPGLRKVGINLSGSRRRR
jgi:hypothetical protein